MRDFPSSKVIPKQSTSIHVDFPRGYTTDRLTLFPGTPAPAPGAVAQQQNPRLLGKGFAYSVAGALSPHPAANHRPEVSLGFFMTGTLATLAVWTTGAVFPVYTTVGVPKG